MKNFFISFALAGFSLASYLAVKSDFSLEKLPVQILILGGKIISPEGSQILDHYCSGNGDTLFLDPSYIKKSPVVLREIEGMKEGQTKNIRFTQKEDWRLSYALNPFKIKKEEGKFKIYQYIKFDRKGRDYTDLNLGFTKLRVKDGMVHVYECKPYVAYCEI
jgi:hypothetical protein